MAPQPVAAMANIRVRRETGMMVTDGATNPSHRVNRWKRPEPAFLMRSALGRSDIRRIHSLVSTRSICCPRVEPKCGGIEVNLEVFPECAADLKMILRHEAVLPVSKLRWHGLYSGCPFFLDKESWQVRSFRGDVSGSSL